MVWGPFDIGVDLGRHSSRFGRPVVMTGAQVQDTVHRFAVTPARAELTGFDGVEVHAAHGYLLSQFETGAVKLVVDRTLPMSEAAGGHRLMEAGGHTGKIILVND